MLYITVPATRLWNEATEEFLFVPEQALQLEHSLVSLSKWESKWCKSFLSDKAEKTDEQILDYIRCMTLTQNVNPLVYRCLSAENIRQINEYIAAPMTATTFGEDKSKNNKEIVTSELIYYWMIALQIPFECQKWHINRLLTLIRVCNIKNAPPGKGKSKRELTSQYAAMNAARRKAHKTRG